MRKLIVASFCLLFVLSGCSSEEIQMIEQSEPSPTPLVGQFDGTYDFSFTLPKQGGGQQTAVADPGFFTISNGVISSSDATIAGTVLDDFGNVRFTGPCWTSSGGIAIWTGIINARSGPKFGEGTYVCQNNIKGGSWHAYNGK